jgi:hypothetical protein
MSGTMHAMVEALTTALGESAHPKAAKGAHGGEARRGAQNLQRTPAARKAFVGKPSPVRVRTVPPVAGPAVGCRLWSVMRGKNSNTGRGTCTEALIARCNAAEAASTLYTTSSSTYSLSKKEPTPGRKLTNDTTAACGDGRLGIVQTTAPEDTHSAAT